MSEIKIFTLVLGELDTNTYIVTKGNEGFLVDPTGNKDVVDAKIAELGVEIKAVLLTHGHFDHAELCKYYQDKGIPAYIHEGDADKLYSKKNYALSCGVIFALTTADVLLRGGENLMIADIKVRVLHTPGHSKGSVAYILDDENVAFVGDTLFKLSYGRTDFYDGNFDELKNSIIELYALGDDYTLYCGHGEATSLDYERRNNPISFEINEI